MSSEGAGSTREARPEDVDNIVRVVNAAYAVERFFVNTDRTYRDEVLGFFESGRFFVSEEADGTVSGAVFLRDEGAEGYFGLLAVAPEHQGHGVGRRLVAYAEEVFREMGCARVRIVVPNLRTELFPWYEALGYQERATLSFPEPEKLTQDAHMVELVKELRDLP